jgi:hypothetical protein
MNIVGYIKPDDKWLKMKEVWDACEKAGIEIPEEVDEYFDGERPDPSGVEIDLEEFAEEYADDTKEGYEIVLSNLPAGVYSIRFFNSY